MGIIIYFIRRKYPAGKAAKALGVVGYFIIALLQIYRLVCW